MRVISVALILRMPLIALALMQMPYQHSTAQTSDEALDAILQDIDQKTDQYAKFRSLLSDEDQARRMAAFSAMTDSGIPALQGLALDHAFSSDDATMRSAALRALLVNTKALAFDITLKKQTSDQTRNTVSNFGGTFSIEIQSWDPKTASFLTSGDAYDRSSDGQGQVSGLTFHYASSRCRLFSVLEDDSKTMTGELACSGFTEPVHIRLSVR